MKKRWVAGAAALIALSMATPAFAGTWVQDSTKPVNENGISNWWYLNDDGSYPAGTWAWIDGNSDGIAESYCFNQNGWMYAAAPGVTLTVDGYEVNENGAWISGGQVMTKNVKTTTDTSSSFSSNSSSLKDKGWEEDPVGRRYKDSEGIYVSGWRKINGKQYYFGNGDYAVTGYQEIDGVKYYFSNSGEMMRTVTSTSADDSDNTNNTNNSSVSADSSLSDDEAYEKIISLKGSYPEGMRWTNDNSHRSGNRVGYGCAGFAFMVQDSVFGVNAKKTQTTTLNWDELRVGDHLRVQNNMGGEHSVIILSIDDESVTLCEGNFNSSIHWGRTMTREELEDDFIYRETCY